MKSHCQKFVTQQETRATIIIQVQKKANWGVLCYFPSHMPLQGQTVPGSENKSSPRIPRSGTVPAQIQLLLQACITFSHKSQTCIYKRFTSSFWNSQKYLHFFSNSLTRGNSKNQKFSARLFLSTNTLGDQEKKTNKTFSRIVKMSEQNHFFFFFFLQVHTQQRPMRYKTFSKK